ncbi:MAG: glycine cleavage T C-terminal barrel domain-containing protein [Pseudomonadota bacterium]
MIPAGACFDNASPMPTAAFRAAASSSFANRWASVSGWTSALSYGDVAAEYDALSRSAGLVDLGCFARLRVWGPDAAAFLERLTTTSAARLTPGMGVPGLICDEDGRVVDTVSVRRLEDDAFLLTMTAPRARRLGLSARGFNVSYDDVTASAGALGVFGPKASEVLSEAGFGAPDPVRGVQKTVRGVNVAVSPDALGPVKGWSLIFAGEETLAIWDRLTSRGLLPVGLDAVDALRLEAGAPRLGADFVGADDAVRYEDARTPFEVRLGALAPLEASWFNGRGAVRARAAQPRRRALLPLKVSGAEPVDGGPVFAEARIIGVVASSAYSPRFRCVLALADIDAGFAERRRFEVGAPKARTGARIAAEQYDPASEDEDNA